MIPMAWLAVIAGAIMLGGLFGVVAVLFFMGAKDKNEIP